MRARVGVQPSNWSGEDSGSGSQGNMSGWRWSGGLINTAHGPASCGQWIFDIRG